MASIANLVPKVVHLDGGRRGGRRYRQSRKDGDSASGRQPRSIMDAPQFMTYRHITGNTEPPKNAQYNPRADELAATNRANEQKRLKALQQEESADHVRTLDDIGEQAAEEIQKHLDEQDRIENTGKTRGLFGRKKPKVRTKVLAVSRVKADAAANTAANDAESLETASVESFESSELEESKRHMKRGSTSSTGSRSNQKPKPLKSKVMRLLLLSGADKKTKTASARRTSGSPSIDPGLLAGRNGPMLMRGVRVSPSMRYKAFVRTAKQRSRSAHSFDRSDGSGDENRNEFGEVNVAVLPKPYAWRHSTKVILEARDARSVDLDHVLDQPKSSVVRQLYWRHLTLEMSAELLDFYDLVDALKSYAYERRLRNFPFLPAHWIWVSYIGEGSSDMINVSDGMRHDVSLYFTGSKAVILRDDEKNSKVANSFLPLDLFDEVQDEVYGLMKSPFTRFKLSASFRRFWQSRSKIWDIRDDGALEIMEGNYTTEDTSSEDALSTINGGASYAQPLTYNEEPAPSRSSDLANSVRKGTRVRASSIGGSSVVTDNRSLNPSPWTIGVFSERSQGLPRNSEGFLLIPVEYFPDTTHTAEPFRTRSRRTNHSALPQVQGERNLHRTKDGKGSFPVTEGERLSIGIMPPKPPLRHSMSTPGAKEAEELAMAAQMPPPSVVNIRPSLGGPPPAPHEQRGYQRISGQSTESSFSSYSNERASVVSGESYEDTKSRHILSMAEQSRPSHMRGPKENWTRAKSGSTTSRGRRR